MAGIAAAHVRIGTHTGMGQKPDDWRVVPLCDGPRANIENHLGCHNRQHAQGEQTFWRNEQGLYNKVDPEALIRELIKASPKRPQIEAEMRSRG